MTDTITGHCLCGAIHVTAAVASHDVSVCHCGMCRRQAGSPMMFIDVAGAPEFMGAENTSFYRSSEWGERGFCKVCGTQLFWKYAGEERYSLSVGMIVDQSQLRLAKEIFVDYQPAFYAFSNSTRRLTEEQSIAEYLAANPDKAKG